jgi:hypothetical protein
MQWITDSANRRNKLLADLAKISQGMDAIWSDLCAALTDSVNYYKQTHPTDDLQTNGQPYSTWTLRRSDELLVTMRLDRAERSIAIERPTTGSIMGFALDPKDTLWLIQENQKLGVQQAATTILRPALFPELEHLPRTRI